MRALATILLIALIAVPASGQIVPDTLDWHGYYPLEIGNIRELHVDEYGFSDLLYREHIVGDTLVDGVRWFVQARYVEGTHYGRFVSSHSRILLRYDDPHGRVLSLSPDTGEIRDLTCDLSGDFGEEVWCGAELGEPRTIVFEGWYASEQYHTLKVGNSYVPYSALKHDPLIFGPVPDVYYHGIGPHPQPGDGFDGTIEFTYLRLSGTQYGSPATLLDKEPPAVPASERYTLYPNPARDRVWMTLPESGQTRSVTVYDVLGRTVMVNVECAESPCELHVDRLSPGLYFVRVVGTDRREAPGRFLVRR